MNVLIAIDSSATAQAAVAAVLAREWPERSEFRVLTVIPSQKTDTEFNVDLDRAQRLLEKACSQIEAEHADSTVVGQIDVGDPALKILAFAKAWPADLIVVGSHDRKPLQRFFLGSVSRTVLQQAQCSVMVARSIALWQSKAKPVKRVLLAVDDTDASRKAVDAVLDSKWAPDTRFHLVSVVSPIYEIGTYEPSALRLISKLDLRSERLTELRTLLAGMAAEFESKKGDGCVELSIVEGEPAECIADIARSWNAHLTILGSNGQQGWAASLFGSSVSHSVALRAPCPVHVLRSSSAPVKPITSAASTTTFSK